MNTKLFLTGLFVLVILFLGYLFFRPQADGKQFQIENISPQDVKEKIQQNEDIVLLDVRTEEEFNGPLGHIDGALLIPLDELPDKVSQLDSLKQKQIIVYCRSGNRSRYATEFLSEKGFKAVNMLGGMKAWNKLK